MQDDRSVQETKAEERLEETLITAREVRSKLEESLHLLDIALAESDKRRDAESERRKHWWQVWF